MLLQWEFSHLDLNSDLSWSQRVSGRRCIINGSLNREAVCATYACTSTYLAACSESLVMIHAALFGPINDMIFRVLKSLIRTPDDGRNLPISLVGWGEEG